MMMEFVKKHKECHREVKDIRRRQMPSRGDLLAAETDCRASLIRRRELTPLAMTFRTLPILWSAVNLFDLEFHRRHVKDVT
jgi:hypothetical protein